MYTICLYVLCTYLHILKYITLNISFSARFSSHSAAAIPGHDLLKGICPRCDRRLNFINSSAVTCAYGRKFSSFTHNRPPFCLLAPIHFLTNSVPVKVPVCQFVQVCPLFRSCENKMKAGQNSRDIKNCIHMFVTHVHMLPPHTY